MSESVHAEEGLSEVGSKRPPGQGPSRSTAKVLRDAASTSSAAPQDERLWTTGTSPYEALYGFSRAIRVGDRILVSGTAPVEADGSSTPGDAAAQARRCFAIILKAIEELGGSAADVVRTRMFITDPGDADSIGAVHGEFFRDVRPAATMVVVKALLRDEWRVEIEAEALLPHA